MPRFMQLPSRLPLAGFAFLVATLAAEGAWALDKQGSAHGGDASGSTSGFNVSGALSLGVAPYNPTYAARPNNTGLTLMRYAGHADVDLIGQRLSIPLDVNLLSDRQRGGAAKLSPTELDIIAGLTSTWILGPGAVEFGARFEQDRQLGALPAFETAPTPDVKTQSYVDARARYLLSAARAVPCFHDRFPHSDVSGWVTLGWFAYNESYFARPDNTGLALLRYALHAELSLFDDLLSFGLDGTMFTDRSKNALRPSELDLTPELIVHRGPFELHVAYEMDMPLDQGSYRQSYLYLLGVWSFDVSGAKPAPLENRGEIL
jgi:hypothetical protein